MSCGPCAGLSCIRSLSSAEPVPTFVLTENKGKSTLSSMKEKTSACSTCNRYFSRLWRRSLNLLHSVLDLLRALFCCGQDHEMAQDDSLFELRLQRLRAILENDESSSLDELLAFWEQILRLDNAVQQISNRSSSEKERIAAFRDLFEVRAVTPSLQGHCELNDLQILQEIRNGYERLSESVKNEINEISAPVNLTHPREIMKYRLDRWLERH